MTDIEAVELCDDILASCICVKPEGHDGNHECACGGGWNADKFPTSWPGSNPAFVPWWAVRA